MRLMDSYLVLIKFHEQPTKIQLPNQIQAIKDTLDVLSKCKTKLLLHAQSCDVLGFLIITQERPDVVARALRGETNHTQTSAISYQDSLFVTGLSDDFTYCGFGNAMGWLTNQ